MKNFNKYFDHTLLKPDATELQIREICREAIENNFASVCVNGWYVPLVCKELTGTDVKIAAVSGFPLGAMSTAAKTAEVTDSLKNGADEIDVVINVGALKDKKYDFIESELSILADICHSHNAILKVILETCLLTNNEIVKACEISAKANADFVKTSTGFSAGGATEEHVRLMKETVSGKCEVKASGGIRTLADAKMINAGADRLGCSASVNIMKEYITMSSTS